MLLHRFLSRMKPSQHLSRTRNQRRRTRTRSELAGTALAGTTEVSELRLLLSSVPVDLSPWFNTDGIANRSAGVDDLGSGNGVDASGGLLVTDSYAFNQSPDGNGLPDNGLIPANTHHPEIQLAYRNSNNGNNLLRMDNPSGTSSVTIDVPDGRYFQLDLAGFATEGSSPLVVALDYATGSTTFLQTTARDWFDEVTDGVVDQNAVQYNLINGMDRYDGFINSQFQNADDPALFGFRFSVDPARTLTSVHVEFEKSDDAHTFNLLGMTLQEIPTGDTLVVDSTEDGIDGKIGPGQMTLREALLYADLRPGHDTIVFAPPEFDANGFISYRPESGPFVIQSDVTIIGNGRSKTLISGFGGLHSLFQIGTEGVAAQQVHVTMQGLTLRNNSAPVRGGGIQNFGTTILKDVALTDLYAYDPVITVPKGGAIYNDGDLTLSNVTMEHNSVSSAYNSLIKSRGYGGAIYNAGQVTIELDSILRKNEARFGGAIYNAGNSLLIVRDSYLGENTAHQSGGAVSAASGSSVQIKRTRIVDNRATNEATATSIPYVSAGAIALKGASLEIDESLVQGNHAEGDAVSATGVIAVGGAIDNEDGSITINRSTFSSNNADTHNRDGNAPFAYGGAIRNSSTSAGTSTLTIRNSTFAYNGANSFLGTDEFGGGVFNADSSILNVFDSTFYENAAGQGGVGTNIWNGGQASISNTILKSDGVNVANRNNGTIAGQYSAFTSPADGFNNGQSGNILVPPNFTLGPLQDNGGSVPTMAPLPDSVTIDNGMSSRFTDQRNLPVQAQNSGGSGIHDIGAVEVQEILASGWDAAITGQSQFGSGDAAVFGFGFDDGQPDSNGDGRSDLSGVQKAPEFLGFNFNPDRFTVGGIEEGLLGDRYGAELTADVDGRFGLEYGFYANSGSVDISQSGQFGFGVQTAADGSSYSLVPSFSFEEGSLYAISPRFGAYADLVLEFNADLSAEAAFVFSASGSTNFGFDKKIPLISINRPSLINGAMVMDGEIELAGSSAIAGLFDALKDSEDELTKAKADRERAEKQLAEATTDQQRAAARAAIDDAETRRTEAENSQREARSNQKSAGTSFGSAKSLIGFELGEADGSLLGLQGTLSVGLGGSSGGVGAEIGKDLGTLAITIPDVALVSNTLESARGTLLATTNNFVNGSEQDLKRQIAEMNIDLGALTGIGGVTNLSLGPIGVEFQTVSYLIRPTLSVNQTISTSPYIKQLQATFSPGTKVSVNGTQRTANGGPVTYLPSDQLEVIPAVPGQQITVTPTAVLGSRLSNKIGLDAQLKGVFEALSFELDFAGETLIDVGPLFEHEHNLGGFDLGTIFDRTFDLPDRTITLPSFVLGTAASNPGVAPGNPLSANQPQTFTPSSTGSQGIVYTSATMMQENEVLYRSLDLQFSGNTVNGIGVLEEDLVVDTFDSSGNVNATIPLTPGLLLDISPGTHFRVRPYSTDKLVDSTEAMVALRFTNPSAAVTMTATPGDSVSVRFTPPENEIRTEIINRQEVNANNAAFEQNTGLDVDGNGLADATSDGLMLLRFIAGLRGQDLINGALASNATRTSAEQIENYIDTVLLDIGNNLLDVDDNGLVEPTSDGRLIVRYLAGMTGDSLINGAIGAGASRTAPSDISAFLRNVTANVSNTTQFDTTDQNRKLRDAAESSAPHDPNVVPGSTPWAAMESTNGTYTLASAGGIVPAKTWFLKDTATSTNRAAWQPLGTVVVGDSDRILPLATSNMTDSATRDAYAARLVVESSTATLGIDAPLFLKLPDAGGQTITAIGATRISRIMIPHDVRGNASHGDMIDVFVPATGSWYTATMDSVLEFPIPVQQFQIYPRALPARSVGSNGEVSGDLALRIGILLENTSTTSQVTVSSLGGGPGTILTSPSSVNVTGTSNITVSRNATTYQVARNGTAVLTGIEGAAIDAVTIQGNEGAAETIRLTLNTTGGPAALPLRINGGGETATSARDILELTGSGMVLDLTGQHVITGIELVDLNGSGGNTLKANLKTIQDNTGTNRTLIVRGGADDVVQFGSEDFFATSDGWHIVGTETIDGIVHDVYRLSRTVKGSQRTEDAEVKIQQGVQVSEFASSSFTPSLIATLPVPGMSSVTGPVQSLAPTVNRIEPGQNAAFSVDLNYSQVTQSASDPSTFVARVHYDSSQVRFLQMSSLFNDGFVGLQDGPETVSDADPTTNRTVTLVWASDSAPWAVGNLNRLLGSVNFSTTAGFSGSVIRLSGTTAQDYQYGVSSQVTVAMDRPFLQSPAGAIEDTFPEFRWHDIPLATGYDLFVEDLSQGRLTVIDIPVTGTSYVHSQPLAIGRYRAWTRATLPDGAKTNWTPISFQVNSQASLHSLDVFSQSLTPTIFWDALPGAVRYDIWVDNTTTGSTQVIRETNVTGTSFTPTSALSIGNHRIWVRGIAADGYPGRWSSAVDTYVGTQLTAPEAHTLNPRPTFTWTSVPGATSFQLWVQAGRTVALNVSGLTQTSFTPTQDLPKGDYTWWVRPFLANGKATPWSQSRNVGIVDRPLIFSPHALTLDSTPTFTWSALETPKYELWVNRIGGPQRVIHQTSLTTNSFTPGIPLTNGNYRAWVRTIASDGTPGIWSKPLDFQMDFRQGPVVVGPAGIVTDPTPEFAWRAIDHVNYYDLWVNNLSTGTQQIIRVKDIPHVTGESEISYQSRVNLFPGQYRWWVRARSEDGSFSAWSAPTDFSVPVPVVSGPAGTITDAFPVFQWDGADQFATYELWVNNISSGTSRILNVTGISGRSYQSALPLEVGSFRFWVRGFDAAGNSSQWSSPGTFTNDFADSSAPALLTPAGNSSSASPTFTWTAVSDSIRYELLVKLLNSSDQPTVIHFDKGRSTSFTDATALAANQSYRWWIRSIGPNNVPGAWSQPMNFRIVADSREKKGLPGLSPTIELQHELTMFAVSHAPALPSAESSPESAAVPLCNDTAASGESLPEQEPEVSGPPEVTLIDQVMQLWSGDYGLPIDEMQSDDSPIMNSPQSV
ncbi:MAG: hypothetical protein KDA91_02230 [Planctomycetaceae bacterium]|nr:hypothetical protein [Planctomycetaceae bacterium]